MKIFRKAFIRNTVLLFVGVTFLNMSFFLAEVSWLKLKKHNAIAAVIEKLACESNLEEERDVGEESSGGNSTKEKEIDLSINHFLSHHSSSGVVLKKKHQIDDTLIFHGGYFETFSPPPELIP